MDRRVVVLNELGQGVWPLAEGVTWFERSDIDERAQILRSVALYCDQARATAVGRLTCDDVRRYGRFRIDSHDPIAWQPARPSGGEGAMALLPGRGVPRLGVRDSD
jgi:hypothetical protein